MEFLYAVFMGLLQGVTEFLPVSSSGHLSLFASFFGGSEPDTLFNVLLHFATLLAVCVFYYKDIWEMVLEFGRGVKSLFSKSEEKTPAPPARRLVLLVVLGTLPLVVVLPFKGFVEALGGSTLFIGCALGVTGALLFLSDRVAKGKKTAKNATVLDAVLVGLGQALAVVPGLSRSGTTIAAGLFRGLDRPFAVRYSFLLSLPAVLGATLLEVVDAIQDGVDLSRAPQYLLGMAVAAVAGYFAIRLVHLLSDKGKFGFFAYYCWGLSTITLFASVIRIIAGL